jgi:hypothetical protein
MLTPEYLLHATEPAEEIAEKLHQDILKRIIERILIRFQRGDEYILTALDKWQIEVLQDAGYLLEDIKKEIAKATGYMQEEIAEAMEDAGVRAIEYDDEIYRNAGLNPQPLTQSPYLVRLMQDTYEQTFGEWTNFTATTAEEAQKLFIRLCDEAYYKAMSGMISARQAVKEALEELITDGVYVEYPTGHRDTIETATARAVRTGISQSSARIQLARMDEFGWDLVVVSSHLGARPSHQVWQGQIYSRNGGEYPDFVSSTEYGSSTGLCGINCRHNFSPYFEGMDNPFEQYDSEENKKLYETEQRARTMERRIRDTKRRLMGYETAGDTERYERTAALLQKQNEAYNAYCDEKGLKKRSDRISIARWNRSEAAKARAAAKRYNEDKE